MAEQMLFGVRLKQLSRRRFDEFSADIGLTRAVYACVARRVAEVKKCKTLLHFRSSKSGDDFASRCLISSRRDHAAGDRR